jgi:hypothetical protein
MYKHKKNSTVPRGLKKTWRKECLTFGRALPLIIAVGKQVANSFTVARICESAETE